MNGTDLVKEIDFGVLTGKPNGQILRMRGRRFEEITIWEEYEQTSRQHLNISDIIELLADVPSIIRKYISDIILSPFEYPYMSELEQNFGEAKKGPNASSCFIPKYIIIYSRPDTNSELIKLFRDTFILWHEAAHLMDRETTMHSEAKYYSNDSEWLKCIEDDHNFNIESKVDAPYYVCRAA